MKQRIIFQKNEFRVVEIPVYDMRYEDLEGDCFCPKVNSDLDPKKLALEQKQFRQKIDSEGVFGYELQKWNPEIGQGWEHVNSCYGFVGEYNEQVEEYAHYIVEEFKQELGK